MRAINTVLPFLLFSLITLSIFSSCADSEEKKAIIRQKYNDSLDLFTLPNDYYANVELGQSFFRTNVEMIDQVEVMFNPLGHKNIYVPLEFVHYYSPDCIYADEAKPGFKYAEVAFPNRCRYGKPMNALITLQNNSDTIQDMYLRLFYQNTSYWHPTDHRFEESKIHDYTDNYYGASDVLKVSLEPGERTEVGLPYQIGMDPKGLFKHDFLGTPRPGNYEFILLAKNAKNDPLLAESLDLKNENPIATMRMDFNKKDSFGYNDNILYVGPHHFKFVFLKEKFDGMNDLTPDHVYEVKHRVEKKLQDGWNGKYRDIISEDWNAEDFFKGKIAQADWVHAPYGNRRENVAFKDNNCIIKIPGSTPEKKQKTWGEIMFGPRFKYGTVTVRVKFAQQHNKHVTPNGIVHNLWLYETGSTDPIDGKDPYKHLTNSRGNKRFEIDFELWTCLGYKHVWNNNIEINYSIVDYMANPDAIVKPGDSMLYHGLKYDRFNDVQLNVQEPYINRNFHDEFHIYKIYWSPHEVILSIDGKVKAKFDKTIGSIPDKYMSLWIGSPLYQDGTYFDAKQIPFLEKDKFTIIDWIKIE